MELVRVLDEVKFYYKHIASLGVLVSLFVLIYYSDAAANAMGKAHDKGLNVNNTTETSLNDSVESYQNNMLNMYITFGVGLILALSVLSIKNAKTKAKFAKIKYLKTINNHFKNILGLGVIATLGAFIYYGKSSVDFLDKVHLDNTNPESGQAASTSCDTNNLQMNRLNAEISLYIAVLLTIMVIGIEEY